jgi:hypothetical protein
MLKKRVLLIIILSFNATLYSQEFETKLDLWHSGLYLDANSIPVKVEVCIIIDGALHITGSLKERDIVRFNITDVNGNSIAQRPSSRTDPVFFESRLQGGGPAGCVVDLHDWFELDREGLYFVSAKWQFTADGKTYTGQTDKKPFRIVSKQGHKVYQLTSQAMTITATEWDGLKPSDLELVTLGESAIPYILFWLDDFYHNMPWTKEVITSFWEIRSLLEVVSQIGSERGRKIITDANSIDDVQRQHYFERIDVWQSPDRYNKLIAKLSTEDTITVKWAIYKLGLLGDSRAVPMLEQIEQQHEKLDIRETARDAVVHLEDSSVPMYYRRHDLSEKIIVSIPKTTYQPGEPIEMVFKLVAGPYGSHMLVQFSKPAYHLLPWGINSEPYRIQLCFDIQERLLRATKGMPGSYTEKEPLPPGVNEYGVVAPIKELQTARRYLVNRKQEPLDGYISDDILGTCEPLNLRPNEMREYVLSDLNECFHLNTSGQYKIYVGMPLFKASSISNHVIIEICDPNSKR